MYNFVETRLVIAKLRVYRFENYANERTELGHLARKQELHSLVLSVMTVAVEKRI